MTAHPATIDVELTPREPGFRCGDSAPHSWGSRTWLAPEGLRELPEPGQVVLKRDGQFLCSASKLWWNRDVLVARFAGVPADVSAEQVAVISFDCPAPTYDHLIPRGETREIFNRMHTAPDDLPLEVSGAWELQGATCWI